MRIVTSITVFNDAVGKRMSITFSEINTVTGKVISDNNRIDRVITENDIIEIANSIETHAQNFVDAIED